MQISNLQPSSPAEKKAYNLLNRRSYRIEISSEPLTIHPKTSKSLLIEIMKPIKPMKNNQNETVSDSNLEQTYPEMKDLPQFINKSNFDSQ